MKVYHTYFYDETCDDLDEWVGSTHKSYRGASQFLIDEGYIPYFYDGDLWFQYHTDEYNDVFVEIIEAELLD